MASYKWGDIGKGVPMKGHTKSDYIFPTSGSKQSSLSNVTDGAGAAGSGGSGGSGSSSSSSSKSSGGDVDAAKKRASEQEKKARKSIGKQYDTVRGGLDQLLGYLPGQQQSSMDRYNTQRDFSRGQAQSSLADAMGRFGGYEGDIRSGQKDTLRDLSSDVRNAFMAGNIYLGSRNASNSSGAEMYSRGIQQAANRNRADVMNQTNTNLADLNIRREEANTAVDRQYAEIDNWFSTSVSDLEAQFNERRQQIEMAKVNATADEYQSLSAMDMELWRGAQDVYNQLLAEADFYAKGVSESLGTLGEGTRGFGEAMDESSQGGYDAPTSQGIDGRISTAGTGGSSDPARTIHPGSYRWKDNFPYTINANPNRYQSATIPDDARQL